LIYELKQIIMKRIIITSTLLAFAVAGFAQQSPERTAPTAEQVAQRDANSLSERLSLSEDQRSKAYNVYLDRAKTQQKEREARMKEMQKQRERQLANNKQQDEKISKFLNADQKTKYQQFQDQRHDGPRGRMNRARPQERFGVRKDARGNRGQRPDGQRFAYRNGPQGPGFKGRPDGRNFRRDNDSQNRPDVRNFKRGPEGQQFNGRPQNMQDQRNSDRSQGRPDRMQNRPDSLQRFERRAPRPQVAPEITTPAPTPADKN
jgi:hypothetical protein